MVDDDEIGLSRALPGSLRKTRRCEGATAAEAAVRADGQLGPEGLRRLEGKLRAIAGLRRIDPRTEAFERLGILLSWQQRATEQFEPVEGLAAQVVLPAFEHGDVHLSSQHGCRNRDVLCEELLLKRLRRRRHDDRASGRQGRDEIRKALPRARAGFRQQMLARFEGIGDGLRELLLLGARLVAVQGGRELTIRSEQPVHALEPRVAGGGWREKFSPRAPSDRRCTVVGPLMVAVLLLTIAAAALLAGLLVVLARSGRTLLDERLGGIEHRLDRRLGEFDERVDRRLEGIDGRPSTHRATGDTETRIVERLTKLDGTTAQMLERAADLTRLEQALRPPKARGGFGELLLENLLRDRLPPSAYEMQYGFKSGERVDAVIRVERLIPVDAKFPLDNFERMVEAEDDAARVLHEKAFARDIKGHVDAIAEKYIAR